MDKIRVLFICVHNSARSQMAEEYLRKYGGDRFDAESAGLEPGELNPFAVEALKKEGMNIEGKQTKSLIDLYKAGNRYDYVITVCSRDVEDKCPLFPGVTRRLNWPFTDPEKFQGSPEEILHQTIELRDVIGKMVELFVEANADLR